MNTLWGDPVDPDKPDLEARAKTLEQYRLYIGGLRKFEGGLVLVTGIDRATSTANVVRIEEASLEEPIWWMSHSFEPQAWQVPWDRLESVSQSAASKIKVWPPLPVVFSDELQDYPVRAELRHHLLSLLVSLIKIGGKDPSSHDAFLIMPQLSGAPTVAWHRNGRCVAGFQLELSEAPKDVHDAQCAKKESTTSTGGAATNAKNFHSYVIESQRIYEEIAQSLSPAPVRRARLFRLYVAEDNCACASIPINENKAIRISIDLKQDIGMQVGTRMGNLLGRAMGVDGQKSNRRWVNQHARRLVRYGVTELRKQPPKISRAAQRELAKQSTSDRTSVIRFGPAGSGKTSVLALVAARLSWLGKRVAIVTFTTASKNVIESRIENETIADRSKLMSATIHELAPGLRKRAVITKAMAQKRQLNSKDFTALMFSGAGPNEFDEIEGNDAVDSSDLKMFDVLLVDEAEDFTADMWNYLLGDDLNNSWAAGTKLQQVFVTFDDAQAALDSGQLVRTFERQAPRQWTTGFFGDQPSSHAHVRPAFTNSIDFGWLKFNLRQSKTLATASTNHRTKFRRADPPVEIGFDDVGDGAVEEIRLTDLTQILDYLSEQSRRADTLIVAPDRVFVAAATLWLDSPGQFVTQSEFLDDQSYEYAAERGDRSRAGIWFEAPLVKTTIYRSNESKHEKPRPFDACSWAHMKLWGLDKSSKSSVRPTDVRTRILTYPAARGHEAETAIMVSPDDGSISSEQLYIGLTRAQKRLIKLIVPPLKELLLNDDSSAVRMVKVLQALRVGAATTEAVWPRLQVDLWRWQRVEGLAYLESGAIEKVLDWYKQLEKELAKEPLWVGETHCLDDAFPGSGIAKGLVPRWRNYKAWIGHLDQYKESK